MGGSLVWVGEPEPCLGHSGQKLFPAAERRRANRAVIGVAVGKGCCVIFFPPGSKSFFFRGRTKLWWEFSLHGSSSHVVVCVWQRVDFFLAVEESFVHPRIHPVSSLCASFSSRWDEFGQNRRGSESTAAPRRGPRVSFTENFQQQSRNFRELKQRVFRHRVGRYTVRVLLATRFLLLSTITVYFTSPQARLRLTVTEASRQLNATVEGDHILLKLHVPVFAYSHCNGHLFPCVTEQHAHG